MPALIQVLDHPRRLQIGSEVLSHAETIVIGNNEPEFRSILERPRRNQRVVDFVRISNRQTEDGQCDGICW